MQKWKTGDHVADTDFKPNALTAAYLEKRANLLRFFARRTHSEHEAEDIVQEIFLRVANHRGDNVDNPTAYLYRLGTNVMLDRVRVRSRALAREHSYHSSGLATIETPSPEAVRESRESLSMVMDVIRSMPSRRQQVFVMHRIEGMTHAEIATSLGISRSAVEKLMKRALRDLGGWEDL